MKSTWFPIVAALVVILISIFFINPKQQIKTLKGDTTASPSATLSPSLSPGPEPSPSSCGGFPILTEYYSDPYFTVSPRLWSPDCAHFAWSNIHRSPYEDQWVNKKYQPYRFEGLFIYTVSSQKVTRIYTPQSVDDAVLLLQWLSPTELTFHKNQTNQDLLYNLSTKKFKTL